MSDSAFISQLSSLFQSLKKEYTELKTEVVSCLNQKSNHNDSMGCATMFNKYESIISKVDEVFSSYKSNNEIPDVNMAVINSDEINEIMKEIDRDVNQETESKTKETETEKSMATYVDESVVAQFMHLPNHIQLAISEPVKYIQFEL